MTFHAVPASRVAIIGAGMAGVAAAHALDAGGHTVRVIDKGRAVGGRMASKRLGDARFDFGAQHFSARSPDFREMIDRLVEREIVARWFDGRSRTQPERGVEPRFKGVPAMRAIPEELARDLDVVLGQRVERLSIGSGTVGVEGLPPADQCIVTAPIAQTLDLIGDVIDTATRVRLADIEYQPNLAALVTLDRPASMEVDHRSFDDGPIGWLSDEFSKGVSTVPAATVISSTSFARKHLEKSPEQWLPLLLDAARPHLGADVIASHGHRCRYSIPTNPLGVGALRAHERIVVAGEAMTTASVEGAFLSGLAAARMIDGDTGVPWAT